MPPDSTFQLQGEEKGVGCGETGVPKLFKRGSRSSRRQKSGPKPGSRPRRRQPVLMACMVTSSCLGPQNPPLKGSYSLRSFQGPEEPGLIVLF